MLKTHNLSISGKDGIKINPINVRDAANCILELIEKPENITFNLTLALKYCFHRRLLSSWVNFSIGPGF